jgi:hypothetical protein
MLTLPRHRATSAASPTPLWIKYKEAFPDRVHFTKTYHHQLFDPRKQPQKSDYGCLKQNNHRTQQPAKLVQQTLPDIPPARQGTALSTYLLKP